MISIDYNLNIIQEKIEYAPVAAIIDPIVNSEKRIFEITADNSYGKTFLLNLIAYALDANKLGDDFILKSLRNSISRYDDNEYYDFNYNIDTNT